MEQWQTVYSTNKIHKAEMLKEILLANNIEAVVFNQQDSTYLFGDIEVKVPNANIVEAEQIIADFNVDS